MVQLRDCLLPLYAVKLKNGIPSRSPRDARYLGVSYHFNDAGNIATCAHVVDSVQDDERLLGVEMHGEGLAFDVMDVKCHSKYDFAVGWVSRQNYKHLSLHGKKDVFIGDSIMAYGFSNVGLRNGVLETAPRLFKGNIVRTHHLPILHGAKSTCEISFPALKGFSGTPLLFDSKEASVAGMVFSNFESTIELHQFKEIDDAGNTFSEQIHKVIELGVVHTAYDIRHFLKDLGVTRVAVADKYPDELET